jgi:twitching motility protein PilT
LEVALKQSLRMAPNVIVVCELRGGDAILTALEAAAGRCLVISTVPTSSPAQTIDYLVNAFPSDHEQLIRGHLGQTLQCVVTQRLIPRADGKGRIPMAAVMRLNTRVRDYIIKGDQPAEVLEETMHDGEMDGMQTFAMDLKRLQNAGLIDEEIVDRYKPKSSVVNTKRSTAPARKKVDLDEQNLDEVVPLDLDRS